MYGPPGRAYVYLIYGYHYCVNAVCRSQGTGEAILIRSIEPEFGQTLLHRNRHVQKQRDLTNGPAKLCEAMNIDRELDGINLCDSQSPLFIAENPNLEKFLARRGPIQNGPRIGISKAADWPLRFYLAGSAFVSRSVVRTSG